MRVSKRAVVTCLLIVCLDIIPNAVAQSYAYVSQTMRPVIRGRQAAVSSMRAEATEAARRILDAGGNAFDAAVAGQAALAVSCDRRILRGSMVIMSYRSPTQRNSR